MPTAPSLRVRPFQQQRRLDDVGPGDLVVVSYGLLQRDSELLESVDWQGVVIDEAQNCTYTQIKMLLTRLGWRSTMVLTGDPDQTDLLMR